MFSLSMWLSWGRVNSAGDIGNYWPAGQKHAGVSLQMRPGKENHGGNVTKGVTPPPISLITLSRDNPDELLKTVRSVYHQSLFPTTYVVVDSSSEELKPRMQHIAEAGGARYVWIQPEGIYPAMVRSLDLVPQESYVWWINSSDWLAGADSVREASTHLSNNPPGHVSWLVGQLIRLKDGRASFHDSGFEGSRFVRRMKTGRIGFPHPATVFWLPHLREVNPFADGLKVASDYATALRFAEKFGDPEMLAMPLSVHLPIGFSANRPVQNILEKARARWSVSSGANKTLEPFRTISNAGRGVWNLMAKNPGGPAGLAFSIFPLVPNSHFCASSDYLVWSGCCDEVLETPFT